MTSPRREKADRQTVSSEAAATTVATMTATTMLGMTGSLTTNVIADTARITTITDGGDMALGLGVVIRNDFRYGDDIESYLKSTIEKLSDYYPRHELDYDADWGIIRFYNEDDIGLDLLLASGFWYVINEFAMADLFNRNYKLKFQTYGLAEALGVHEVWYCDEYAMDPVCPKYTFEEFMSRAMISGIIEVDENLLDDYDTTYFHEEIEHLSHLKKMKIRYSIVIIGSVDKIKAMAERHGVELVLGTFHGDNGYTFEVEQNSIEVHPFLKELSHSKEVFGISRYWAVVHPDELIGN